MSEIKRYDLGEVANYEGAEPRLEPGMVEDETGIYVLYSARQAELAALREELKNIKAYATIPLRERCAERKDLQQRLADAERLLTRAKIYARGEFRDEIDACLLKAERMNK